MKRIARPQSPAASLTLRATNGTRLMRRSPIWWPDRRSAPVQETFGLAQWLGWETGHDGTRLNRRVTTCTVQLDRNRLQNQHGTLLRWSAPTANAGAEA